MNAIMLPLVPTSSDANRLRRALANLRVEISYLGPPKFSVSEEIYEPIPVCGRKPSGWLKGRGETDRVPPLLLCYGNVS